MSKKPKKKIKNKGLSNSQVNFLIAKAMRSGAFKKLTALAESGASREELREAVETQYAPKPLPGQKISSEDSTFLQSHLDKIVDELQKRYGPKLEVEEV